MIIETGVFLLLGAFTINSIDHVKKHEEEKQPELSRFIEECTTTVLPHGRVSEDCTVRYRDPRDCD